MRVISGSARGTKLKTLSGADIIRPTTDRVKESLFNIIQFDIYDAMVLDVFCGSGALGIEALSRGAAHCDFADINTSSLNTAKDNARTTHLSEKASFHKSDFESYILNCKTKYDLIFADPPYAAGFLQRLLEVVSQKEILNDSGKLIFEASSDEEPADVSGLELYRTAVYGNTKIFFYRKNNTI